VEERRLFEGQQRRDESTDSDLDEPDASHKKSRHGSCPNGSRPVRGWLATVYVEVRVFLMTIDTGSTMTMIDTKASFQRFLHTRLKPPQRVFQMVDGSEMKITGEAEVRMEVGTRGHREVPNSRD
jgi:hypothetical protein